MLRAVCLGSGCVSAGGLAAGGQQIRRFLPTPRGVVRLNQPTGGFFMGAGGLLLTANR